MSYKDNPITPFIVQVIENQIKGNLYGLCFDQSVIYGSLRNLLNGDYEKYTFNEQIVTDCLSGGLAGDSFQLLMSKINEKQENRKETGRYYTPSDVTKFIVANTFINSVEDSNDKVYSYDEIFDKILNSSKLNSLLFKLKVFDPTAGTSEFLISALEIKFLLYERIFPLMDDSKYLNILNTIHGNDLNITSIEISKIRMFFTILPKLQSAGSLNKAVNILNKNFTAHDFINWNKSLFGNYDIIVGNPPYYESSKLIEKPLVNYGNVYANILDNCSQLLNSNSVIGFVLPLSFISTSRMAKIRSILTTRLPKQFILNFADRPDCLFASVHQKLSILIASNAAKKIEVYTSGYKYWYKSERKALLGNTETVRNYFLNDSRFIPKIANTKEIEIFQKIYCINPKNSFYNISLKSRDNKSVFLNMRACFWFKAFSFNPGSNEYKIFSYPSKVQPYILCLLNSSLVFFFWTLISDCWHITSKELSTFNIQLQDVDFEKFRNLSKKLEKRLDETKQFIGTKQIEYAYKHKYCKDIIDEIDDELAFIYNLSSEELSYIKNYNIKYRIGEDAL